MAGKSNTSATFFAQKKLLGKAHTSNLKTDGEELIGSNVQTSTGLIFGEKIPTSPTKTDFLISSASADDNGTVEYITFSLNAITGTTYDADQSGGGGGSDTGEGSQSAGPHAYKFALPSDYVASSSNTKKGNGVFNNGRILHETLGQIQLVPPFFSQDAPNPYIVKIYKDDGSGGVGAEIPLLDNIDWNVDFFNGVLFVQDYDASKIPAHARGFIYVGKTAEEVIASGSSSGGGGGDSSATYIVQTATGSLSNERVLTAGTGIKSADGGANGNFTISIDNSVVATLTGSEFSGRVGVTGSIGATAITGSHTELLDGSSFIKHAGSVTVTSSSAGQITVSSPNYVFNEFIGQGAESKTLFSLNHSPTAPKNVSVFVNGLLQMPATSLTSAPFQDYSITGSNIYFTTASAPDEGSIIVANYLTSEAI